MQGVVALGLVTGQPEELGDGNRARAVGSPHVHGRVEDGQRDRHVRRVNRHAGIAGTEEGVLSVEAVRSRHSRNRELRLLHCAKAASMK